ncbi:MAG: hypothetical protein ABIP64_10915 [Burkholderiales bacterium]
MSFRTAMAALLMLNSPFAFCHSQTGYNLRAAHFEHTPAGLMMYMRISLPLVVANKLGQPRKEGGFVPAPFTYNRVESGKVSHYLDIAAVKRDITGLGQLVLQGHELRSDGKVLTAKLISTRAQPKGNVPPFARLEDAKSACAGVAYPERSEEMDTGYVLIDVAALYPRVDQDKTLAIKSSLIPGELGEPATKNIFWEHRGSDTRQYDAEGLLDATLTIGGTANIRE